MLETFENIQSVYAKYMYQCSKSIWKVSRTCPTRFLKVAQKYLKSVPQVSRKCPNNFHKVFLEVFNECFTCVLKVSEQSFKSVPKSLPKVYQKYPTHVKQVCPTSVRQVCKQCLKHVRTVFLAFEFVCVPYYY
jgi:hypothetical protein